MMIGVVQSRALGSLASCNGSSMRLAPCFQRLFHSTPPCRVNALFAESRDSELGSTLKKIQDTLIAPSFLSLDERKAIFGSGGGPNRDRGPMVANIDGIEYKFTLSEDSRYRFNWTAWNKMLNEGLRAMQKADDWSNLPTLLAGFKKARIRIPSDHLGRICRYAGGNPAAVIECAQQASRTGFVFSHLEVVVRLLVSVNSEMIAQNMSEAAAKQAVSRVETVLDLLLRPEHAQPQAHILDRLHMSLLVRGLVLFSRAAAVRAKQASGQSTDDKDLTPLRDELQLLISLWEGVPTQNLLAIEEFSRMNPVVEVQAIKAGKQRYSKGLNGIAYLELLAQLRQGIAWTRALLGDEADKLAPVQDAIDKLARQFMQEEQNVAQSKPAWAEAWEKVTGERIGGSAV